MPAQGTDEVDWNNQDPATVIYKIGIYGWRKRCVYFLILLIMVITIINLSLVIWIMRVMDFNLVTIAASKSNIIIHLSCWNVHGLSKKFYLGDKLSNDNFLCSFKNNDIIILTETWSNEELSIPVFHLFTIPAKKHRMKKHGRFSGGIALGFKNSNLKQGITLVSYHDDYIWCKLDKHFFHTKKDIFVCAAYIPPKESSNYNSDIFHDPWTWGWYCQIKQRRLYTVSRWLQCKNWLLIRFYR